MSAASKQGLPVDNFSLIDGAISVVDLPWRCRPMRGFPPPHANIFDLLT